MSGRDRLALVAGGGGFIGGWLVASLLAEGHRVRSVDNKAAADWYQVSGDAENLVLDLRELDACHKAVHEVDWVFDLACDMGGMGFIETNKVGCMVSVLIGTHMLLAASSADVERFFFASSACVYRADKQDDAAVEPLKEADAYPAMPEDGYGWEKLFTERMCRHFADERGLPTCVARYHNVYGPHGAWEGGRAKAPAAICRKVATAVLDGSSSIEIWGDGEQTRTFTYIDDCLEGTRRVMHSEVSDPVNVGSSELVTINHLVDAVEAVAGAKLERQYRLDAPTGVRGRSSDNTLIRERLGWEPSTSLAAGIEPTYRWVHDQLSKRR